MTIYSNYCLGLDASIYIDEVHSENGGREGTIRCFLILSGNICNIITFMYYIIFPCQVASDSHLVELLYHKLTAAGVKVWWDKQCLEFGKPWDEGKMNI